MCLIVMKNLNRFLTFLILTAAFSFFSCKEDIKISADEEQFQKNLQKQLIDAVPGDIIRLPEGTFRLSAALSLNVDGITIKGAGIDKTVLDFTAQKQGAEGMIVTANDFLIEDLTIQNTKGDAIKINESKNVTLRRIKTWWTGGPKETNGAYGMYPVQCENVLIENSVAIGASDAGIYVGQSKNIIVRNNKAKQNVAGIEIENSTFADVHDNLVTENTGGILVFDLPDLQVQGGNNTRVFNNKIISNNTSNFAPEGNIVGEVPAGTGVMIMANDSIEVFKNEIRDNKTAGVLIVSYLITEIPVTDEKYDPYPERIYIHDNQITGGGDDPTGGNNMKSKAAVALLAKTLGTPLPGILWDGIINSEKYKDGKLPDDQRICLKNNGDRGFANIDAGNDFAGISRDLKQHDCEYEPLEEIKL